MNSLTMEPTFHRFKWIVQPLRGFRFSVDSVILAHSVRSVDIRYVVELGAGSGIISLLLYSHSIGKHFWLIERNPVMCDALYHTVDVNRVHLVFDIICSDVSNVTLMQFADLVIFNPPYYSKYSSRGSMAVSGDIDSFLEVSAKLVNNDGIVAYIISDHQLDHARQLEEKLELHLLYVSDYYSNRGKHRYVRILSPKPQFITFEERYPLNGERVQKFYHDGRE